MSETMTATSPPSANRGDGAEEKRRAAEAIKEKAEAVREWAGDRADLARSWASERAGKVRELVAGEPVMAVTVSTVVAFAAGAVVGLLIGRMTAD